ncbi:MAG: cell envelope integrity protein CreD [Proteobacteria bacterium]|nr:MAG: cell envelope integrity protein CreD [Pseudomonadota bacterium]
MHYSSFGIKLIIISLLIIGLLVPQISLMGLISERASWRNEAYHSIGQSWPGQQTLAGPVLIIPYSLTYDSKEKIREKDGTERIITKSIHQDDTFFLIPKKLTIKSKLDSSLRYRGIYEVPVYGNQLQINGLFDTQPLLDLIKLHKNKEFRMETPLLSVLVSDQRGIASPPSLKWDNRNLAFKPGSQLPNASAGMHTYLPELRADTVQQFSFAFDLQLRGMSAMNFALLSENSKVSLFADWAHPKFTGELLPESRDINQQGFSAEWLASSFSYNVSDSLEGCRQGQCASLLNRAVGFELLQPVDVYHQSERSVKYAILFVLLTFVVMVLFELLKGLRIHPVQYALVGIGLTVFYLLLISLSEHISFVWAYSLAALAISTLLASYFGAILKSRTLGLMLGGGLLLLYSLLYFILQAEDKALLMGSLLIFALLAALMLSTRHLDWYALTNKLSPTLPNK